MQSITQYNRPAWYTPARGALQGTQRQYGQPGIYDRRRKASARTSSISTHLTAASASEQKMKISATRKKVCATDDGVELQMEIPTSAGIEGALKAVLETGYLPTIGAGRAMWTIKTSNRFVAVVAQDCPEMPEPWFTQNSGYTDPEINQGAIDLTFEYHSASCDNIIMLPQVDQEEIMMCVDEKRAMIDAQDAALITSRL